LIVTPQPLRNEASAGNGQPQAQLVSRRKLALPVHKGITKIIGLGPRLSALGGGYIKRYAKMWDPGEQVASKCCRLSI